MPPRRQNHRPAAPPLGAAAGSEFEQLYREEYTRLVRRVIVSGITPEAADEVVSSAFSAMWLRWKKLGPPDEPVPYLRASVSNGIRDYWKRELAERERILADPVDEMSLADSRAAFARSVELAQDFQDLLDKLPPRQREILILQAAGFPRRDIAQRLALSEKTVAKHLERARATIRLLWSWLLDA
ncbi:sigma-70 family RNA polymerase sigma factor [Streptomyces sp. NPDC093970]|uniref:RNA polymerase sigma factor n=1 Tax=Streptomyces sp. NPDC093970 TaxID=3155076 RepID=UPI0034464FD0